MPTRATMSGAPSAKSRLCVLPKTGVGEHAAGRRDVEVVVPEPGDVADAAQHGGTRRRRRAGDVERHGLFEPVVVEGPVRRSAAVGGGDVIARPDALPRDVKSARRIEGIDLDVAHPPHRRQVAGVPIEPGRARHIPLHRWNHRHPARSAVGGPIDPAGTPVVERRDDKRPRMGGVGRNSAEAPGPVLRLRARAHVCPGVAHRVVSPNRAEGDVAGPELLLYAR